MEQRADENLRALFEQFLSSEEAEKAAGDIQAAEQMLRQYPAPQPDAATVADIKATLKAMAGHRRTGLYTAAYRVAVVAAVIMVLSAVTVRLWERHHTQGQSVAKASVLPDAIWESNDATVGDPVLAFYMDELEMIADQVQGLQTGSNGSRTEETFEELQSEFVEISSDFWKG